MGIHASFHLRPDHANTTVINSWDMEDHEKGTIVYDLDLQANVVWSGSAWGLLSSQSSGSFSGGFVDYNDSTTAGTPISLSAGVPTVLTNDGAGAFTNKTYLPTGVTDVWDEVDSFDWSDLEVGDMLDIRMDIVLTTGSPNTTVEVDLHLGTGGSAYTVPFVTDADFKDAGTHTINKYNGIYMGDTNTLNNGGQFKITCDKNSTVVVNGWYVKIIRRG